jgi:UPF0755 protein
MKIKIFYPVTLLFFFFLGLFVNLAFFNRVFRESNEEVKVKIIKGDNLKSVSIKLEQNGVIFNRYFFIIAGKIFGHQNDIIPGEYNFNNGLSNLDILKEITNRDRARIYTITIPEGMNVRQIGRLLSRQYGLDSAKFVHETYNDSLISLLDLNAENLEGFLFPETYEFNFSPNNNAEREIVLTMAFQFRKKFTPEMKDKMKNKGMKLKNVVTMASIIDGETRYDPEKKVIAGVYYNRLRKKMKLEADPTVQYIIPDGPKRRLTYNDLKYNSPYNTYLYRGLPPGPINNPGLSSIMAAIEPDNNKYLYFVAKGDGSHRFAETYEEHKKNIKEYKKYLLEKESKNEK